MQYVHKTAGCGGSLVPNLSDLVNPEVGVTAPARVGEVMTREVISLSPHHSFQEAITLLARHRFRHFLVIGGGTRVSPV